tara:strand:+ start:726 stop:974 length:249 start_codon:yes stop_codon:yes gene_type:complete
MEVNSIAQILSAKLILMDDPDKAAKFLYELVDININSKNGDRESMKDFVMATIRSVVSHDEKYADDMAKKYLLYVVGDFMRP